MAVNIPSRIITVRDLVIAYYPLPDGAPVYKHNELLRFVDIDSTKRKKHPHQAFRVYISRKALKHFTEVRKRELSKSHDKATLLSKICFIIEQIPEVIISFDKYEYEHDPEKHFYTKHYSGEPSVRVLCEISKKRKNALEICSMHFIKQKKAT